MLKKALKISRPLPLVSGEVSSVKGNGRRGNGAVT